MENALGVWTPGASFHKQLHVLLCVVGVGDSAIYYKNWFGAKRIYQLSVVRNKYHSPFVTTQGPLELVARNNIKMVGRLVE